MDVSALIGSKRYQFNSQIILIFFGLIVLLLSIVSFAGLRHFHALKQDQIGRDLRIFSQIQAKHLSDLLAAKIDFLATKPDVKAGEWTNGAQLGGRAGGGQTTRRYTTPLTQGLEISHIEVLRLVGSKPDDDASRLDLPNPLIYGLIAKVKQSKNFAISDVFTSKDIPGHLAAILCVPVFDDGNAQKFIFATLDLTNALTAIEHEGIRLFPGAQFKLRIANSSTLKGPEIFGQHWEDNDGSAASSESNAKEDDVKVGDDAGAFRDAQFSGVANIGYVSGTDWALVFQINSEIGIAKWNLYSSRIALTIFGIGLFGIVGSLHLLNRERTRIASDQLAQELKSLEMQNRFNFVSKNTNDAIFLIDETGNVIEANQRAETIYGFGSGQLVGRDINVVFGRDHTIESDFPLDSESEETHVRRDGSTIIARVFRHRIILEGISWEQLIVQDISAQRAAEFTAKDVERKLTKALDSLNEGYCMVDYNWRCIYVNRASARHAGSSISDMRGKLLQEVLPNLVSSDRFGQYQTVMHEREAMHFETLVTYTDKSARWFDLIVEPIPEGISIMSIDISQRKMEEEKLLAASLIVSKGAAVFYRTDRGSPARITYVSENISTLGYRVEEVVGIALETFVHPADVLKTFEASERTFKQNLEHGSAQYRLRKKDGEYVLVNDRHRVLLNADGEIVGAEGVFIQVAPSDDQDFYS